MIYKIASWNLNFAASRVRGVASLTEIKNKGISLLLAQEMYLPDNLENIKSIYPYSFVNNIPKSRPEGEPWRGYKGNNIKNNNDTTPWGTAIFSTLKITEIKLNYNYAYPGTITLVKDENDIYFASIYGKSVTNNSYHDIINLCIKELEAYFDYNLTDKKIIIAGDWNIGPFKSNKVITIETDKIFAKLESLGFVNQFSTNMPDDYKSTFYGNGKNQGESQIDWMFIKGLESTLCLEGDINKELSDHCPIITEIYVDDIKLS